MELNPNHPTTSSLRQHWHKIAAVLMSKQRLDHIVLSLEDLEVLRRPGGINIVAQELPDGLHLRLVNDREARRLARQQGAGQS